MTFGSTSVWTAETTAHFERLFAAKLSFGQIAHELQQLGYSINRNACIGKARRMKISNGRKPGNRYGDTHAHAPPMPKAAPKIVCTPVERIEPHSTRTGHLIDLDADQCRWPMTNDKPFLFCTRDAIEHSPYCAHHHARAYTVASSKGSWT